MCICRTAGQELNPDQVAKAIESAGDLNYVRRAMHKYPGRRGFINLRDLTQAINSGEFPPPKPGAKGATR